MNIIESSISFFFIYNLAMYCCFFLLKYLWVYSFSFILTTLDIWVTSCLNFFSILLISDFFDVNLFSPTSKDIFPPIPPSIRVFSIESTLHMRWPKYWSFSFSIVPSKEIPGLISFRMDWFDLLVVQGTLKSLLQHHSSKASILRCSAFFIIQLSHPHMTTGKTIALTRQNFVLAK